MPWGSYLWSPHCRAHATGCPSERPTRSDPHKTSPESNERIRRSPLTTRCGYCFLSRSVAAKEMCCIFWMLATHAMPTGCGLSIRRLRRSKRTWQPYRYISSQWTINPSDSAQQTRQRETMILFRKHTSDRRDRGFHKHVAAKGPERRRESIIFTLMDRRCWNTVISLDFFYI